MNVPTPTPLVGVLERRRGAVVCVIERRCVPVPHLLPVSRRWGAVGSLRHTPAPGVLLQQAPEREYPLLQPARSAPKTGAPSNEYLTYSRIPAKGMRDEYVMPCGTKAVCATGLSLFSPWRCAVSKRAVSPRPAGEGWEWIEEFGGGEWVKYPVPPKPVLPGASRVLASVLYGPGYQGPAGTRSTTGIWTDYPG